MACLSRGAVTHLWRSMAVTSICLLLLSNPSHVIRQTPRRVTRMNMDWCWGVCWMYNWISGCPLDAGVSEHGHCEEMEKVRSWLSFWSLQVNYFPENHQNTLSTYSWLTCPIKGETENRRKLYIPSSHINPPTNETFSSHSKWARDAGVKRKNGGK